MEKGGENKGQVCVTGGTGFLASWLIFKLLQRGYSVNTTIRPSPPGSNRDISYLTSLPGAPERLRIFYADLDKPDTYDAPIEGCIGVFHVAHPLDYERKETEEEKTWKSVNGALGILQACLKAKTVKRVVYTSGASTVMFPKDGPKDSVDESSWSDIDLVRSSNIGHIGVVAITKTLTEKACLKFAEKNGLDLVTVIPSWVHGPFIRPSLPGSLRLCLSLILGDKQRYKNLANIPLVHTDDLVAAHIFLFEHPGAKGRFICSALQLTVEKLYEFLARRYPEYHIEQPDTTEENAKMKYPELCSKKLLDAGFEFKYGLEEMYDDAIQSCKQKGLL